MKPSIVTSIFSHPLTQLLSFCVILINGQVFAAPYGWYIRYALPDGEWFAYVGAAAIGVTVLGFFTWRRILQGSGLLLMWLSLILFIGQSTPEARLHLVDGPFAPITHLVFLVVTVVIITNYVKWKNF